MKLPVSGLEIAFRSPAGSDDLALLEAGGNEIEGALVALARLAAAAGCAGEANRQVIDWPSLTVTDFECALLGLRRFLAGDEVHCLLKNDSHGCGERMEMSFSVAALLEEATPRAVRGVAVPAEKTGWYQMAADGGAVHFRLPAVNDQLAVLGRPGGAQILLDRCTGAQKLTRAARAKVERAMEALAPPVSRMLEGRCPACGQAVTAMLEVPRLVMEEWTHAASGIHAEIDWIAAEYHWEEAAILAMPQRRRKAYADWIRERKGSRE